MPDKQHHQILYFLVIITASAFIFSTSKFQVRLNAYLPRLKNVCGASEHSRQRIKKSYDYAGKMLFNSSNK